MVAKNHCTEAACCAVLYISIICDLLDIYNINFLFSLQIVLANEGVSSIIITHLTCNNGQLDGGAHTDYIHDS